MRRRRAGDLIFLIFFDVQRPLYLDDGPGYKLPDLKRILDFSKVTFLFWRVGGNEDDVASLWGAAG